VFDISTFRVGLLFRDKHSLKLWQSRLNVNRRAEVSALLPDSSLVAIKSSKSGF
jgi:hypothetical protein